MADSIISIDVSQLLQGMDEFKEELSEKLILAAKSLSIQADAHVRELASGRLNSRREVFLENLEWEQIDDKTFAVVVKEDALWIEDGKSPGNMLSDLLASPKAKTGKSGNKYLIIPFKHNKKKGNQTPQQRQLLASIKSEMRRQKIPYSGIESNQDGSPKTGLLHSFNVQGHTQKRAKPGFEGPSGMPGGTNSPGAGQAGPGGRPFTWGTRVYQNHAKGPDGKTLKDGNGHDKVERGIFTFRVASSTQAGSGMWDSPGNTPMHFLEETARWAEEELEQRIFPDILKGLGVK